ncbi:MAG: asparagine synthase (glutamine-hydrolyzing) [Blastocatellia bacterium]
MCGIAGIIGPEILPGGMTSGELIRRMCEVITHRGPDDEGYHLSGRPERTVALGMRRLSVIDVATGQQPVSNEDGTIHIVFNGEIYNHRELRADLIARGHRFRTASDTETIVHLYEDLGERCVEKLRGMFAFAIQDERAGRLLLARDRVGKKPLHYAQCGEHFIFGSEIKSLLRHPAIRREVSFEALADFVTFGYVPDPRTAFQGIHKLPPGHTLSWQDGQIRLRRYWDFEYARTEQPRPPDETHYLARLRELLAEAVRLRLESEVPLGAFLSGGIDSSTVVALMAQVLTEPVRTFSIGFRETEFDELSYARLTARLLKTDHHEFIVSPDVCRIVEEIVRLHDEPFADVSSIPTYVVSGMAREHVTVVLTGDGGDEVFGGYERYLIEQRRDWLTRIPRPLRYGLLKPLSRSLPQGFYGKRWLGNLALEPAARFVENVSYFNADARHALFTTAFHHQLGDYDPARMFEELYRTPTSAAQLEHRLYLDSRTYLPGDVLVKVDRMSMAHSIETRSPLLDHRLIEFVQTIPAELKVRGTESKHILKRAVRGLVPDEIIHRPKQGFDVPLRHWLNAELKEMLDDTLNSRSLRERGYFSPAAITAIVNAHRRGVRDHARDLWSLLTLELWHRMFIDRQPEPAADTRAISFDEWQPVGTTS